MNIILELLSEKLVSTIGWTIIHSVWQGAVIAFLLFLTLTFLNKKDARFRYQLACLAMVLLFTSALLTFARLYSIEQRSTSVIINGHNNFSELGKTPRPFLSSPQNSDEFNLSEFISSNLIPGFPLIVTIWLVGFIIFLLRFIAGALYLNKLRYSGLTPINNFWLSKVNNLSIKMGLRHYVTVRESIRIKTPVAIGFIKPLILLPIGLLSALPIEQVESIIAHELAHLRRFDFLINLIQTLIETILFYNPAVWWFSSVINAERENCCDDIVVNVCGDYLSYSKALFNLLQINSDHNSLAQAATGKTNHLFRRIYRMTTKNNSTSTAAKFAAIALLLISISALTVFTTLSAKENPIKTSTASFVNPFSGEPHGAYSKLSEEYFQSTPDTTPSQTGTRTFKFKEEINGERKKFTVKLKNGLIEDLFINGNIIDKQLAKNYESLVNQRISEYDSAMNEFRQEKNKFFEKMKKFDEDYAHIQDSVEDPGTPPVPHQVSIPQFNSGEFRKMMKDLKKNLHESFANHSFTIPPISIPEITIPPIEVDKLNIDLDKLDFDKEAFEKSMSEWGVKFSKEMENFKDEMAKHKNEIKESMRGLENNMKNLRGEMKSLKGFLKEAKSEMVSDHLVKSGDDIKSFVLSKDELMVNGKKIAPELHSKYLGIYKKHYGKDLTDSETFNLNN